METQFTYFIPRSMTSGALPRKAPSARETRGVLPSVHGTAYESHMRPSHTIETLDTQKDLVHIKLLYTPISDDYKIPFYSRL